MSSDANPTSNANAATSSTAPTNTLSKSQKKRMKRNASKARKEALEKEQRATGVVQLPTGETTSLGGSDGTGAALNPHVKLRSDLVAEGYTIDDVERAIDDMWNLQLPYDEFESVLAYLEARKVQEEVDEKATSANEPADLTASTAETSVPEEEQSPSSPASVAGESSPEETADEITSDAAEEAVVNEQEEISAATASEKESVPSSKASKPKKATPPPPMDLAAKLELVANFENISDAVAALSEWMSKAAKSDEIAELCDLEKTKALLTVVRRVILECTDQSEFDTVIMPGLSNIISSILRSFSGLSPSAFSSVADALENALKQAICAIASSESVDGMDLTDNIATSTSSFVVSAVCRYVEYGQNTGPNSGLEKVRRLEEEIDALAASIASNSKQNGVFELMTKRDCHKLAAEKSSTVFDIAIFSLKATKVSEEKSETGLDPVSESNGNLASEEGRGELLTSLLGDEYDAVISSQSEFNALKVGLEDARSETATQRKALMDDRASYETERDRVTTRMDELRKELEGLEQENESLTEKIDDIDERVILLDDSCGDEVKGLKAKITEQAKLVKLESDTQDVVKKLGSFESSLFQLSSQSDDLPQSSLAGKVSNKMGIYLVRMRNYFKAESDIVEFICGRVRNLESGLKDLEREIDECAVLGMTTNVNQMTQQLSTSKQNIEEDNTAIAALRGDAEKMRDNLMKRLEEYDGESGEAFSALHMSVLNGIASAMTRIGLASDGGLAEYILSHSDQIVITENGAGPDTSPIHTSDAVNGENGIEKATNDTSSKPLDTFVVLQEPVKLPKFSWAVKTTSEKKPIKSLLDIQKEELSAKSSSN